MMECLSKFNLLIEFTSLMRYNDYKICTLNRRIKDTREMFKNLIIKFQWHQYVINILFLKIGIYFN